MSLFTHPTYLLTLLIVLAIWATPDVVDSLSLIHISEPTRPY